MPQLTHMDRTQILDQYFEARNAGNDETASRILKGLPLPSWLAEAGRDLLGKDAMLQSGYDLSEAEATYGKGWLDR